MTKPEQEYDTYPVRRGEVWACGLHRYRCGDLRDWAPPPHTLVYSDPPWGDGPLRAFHTNAGLPRPEYDWALIYRMIIGKADRNVPVWLESGKRQEAGVITMLSAPGRMVVTYAIRYQRKYDCRLHYAGSEPPPEALSAVLTGMNDTQTPTAVLGAYGRGVVLDPCAGRGWTAVCAQHLGWRSENNELDPRRVSAALARMREATGLVPRRIE